MSIKRWDHELVIGDTYEPAVVTVTDAAGDAYDLTGATGEVQLRPEAGGELLLEPTVTLVDAAAGQFTWTAAAAATASLQPGSARYSVRITFADGTIRTLLEGRVAIRRGIVE